MSFKAAKKKFTSERYGVKYSMRRKKDEHFGRICQFFDTEIRRCTVYKARPHICRAYPTGKCGYWEFLKIERETQDDPEFRRADRQYEIGGPRGVGPRREGTLLTFKGAWL